MSIQSDAIRRAAAEFIRDRHRLGAFVNSSREEGGSLPFFEAADKNKDGFLTTAEVQAYFATRRGARLSLFRPVRVHFTEARGQRG